MLELEVEPPPFEVERIIFSFLPLLTFFVTLFNPFEIIVSKFSELDLVKMLLILLAITGDGEGNVIDIYVCTSLVVPGTLGGY